MTQRLSGQPAGGLVLAVLAAFAFMLPLAAADEVKPAQAGKTIELAICLDTSNSMDGLIASAKVKLWDIVNDLAKAKPTPILRVALYSYGNNGYDRNVGWVRKELHFTTDLDKVNEKLFGLTTNGGTEYVGRVTRDAVEQLAWSPDPAVLKLIFVCGNEAATQDPEIKLQPLAEAAVRKGIVINTIYCGDPNHSEAQDWKQFADLSEGRFASINQNRGAVAIATPVDKRLAELGAQLNTTFCWYGKDAKVLMANQVLQDANTAKLGVAAEAGRAQTKGGGLYRYEQNDLVERCKADPKFDVKTVAVEELSDELKKMTPEQREKHVKELLAKRLALEKEITDLGKQREAYIAQELKKNGDKGERAFDEAVRGAIREQAQKKGIQIP
jgi:hypothetical protein